MPEGRRGGVRSIVSASMGRIAVKHQVYLVAGLVRAQTARRFTTRAS